VVSCLLLEWEGVLVDQFDATLLLLVLIDLLIFSSLVVGWYISTILFSLCCQIYLPSFFGFSSLSALEIGFTSFFSIALLICSNINLYLVLLILPVIMVISLVLWLGRV